MGGLIEKIVQWWRVADRNQRLATIGAIAVAVLVIGGTIVFATRPKYETLFANLTEQEQSSVVTDLQGMGFDVKFDRAGVVEVLAGQKAAARIKLAAANKLPKVQGQWGLGELNTTHFGETPSIEQERLKAIMEGEIAKSIEAMEGIDSARVHLTLPPPSVFTAEQKPATAAISVVESQDGSLSTSQGRAIALLVRNAVERLDMKDIVVVNQHLRTVWNGEDEDANGIGGAQRKTEIDQQVSMERQRVLQSLLDGAFGYGAAIVTVHADVDMDSEKKVAVLRKPTGTSAVTNSNETVVGSAPPVGGVAGLQGQTPTTPTAAGAAANTGNYKGGSETKESLVSEQQIETNKAIGAIKAMAINVVVDKDRISNPDDVQSVLVGDLGDKIKVDPVTKLPLPNQAYSVKVTPVSFDKSAAAADAAAATALASQQRTQQLISMLPIGALLLVALMIMRQLSKFAKSGRSLTGFGPQAALAGAGADTGALPAADVHSLLAEVESLNADDTAHGLKLAHMRMAEDEDSIEVENIKNKVHIPLEQLKKLANERPALVAQLIKSMLLEERK